MSYLTTKETAERWGVNISLVRRLCTQNRIPGAIRREGAWLIPADVNKPKRPEDPEFADEKLPTLAKKLTIQKKKKSYHGLYDYAVIDFTYSSSRMASNRLTRGQVETIFKKGKVSVAFEPMKVSDVIEVLNHCFCVDHIIDTIMEPLTIKYIKNLHYLLTFGTVDERKKKVTPGQFRTSLSKRKERFALPADSIQGKLKVLLAEYEAYKEVERWEILDFHVRFERIFPFDDYNGRIGRLLMFKECLRHGVMPFVIDDKRRGRYLEGLHEWDYDRSVLSEVVLEAQARFEAQIELQKLRDHEQNFLPAGFTEG